MYHLRRFLGERFERINTIVDNLAWQLDNNIILIASASYPFPEVLQALGYPLSTFPSEGMPGARYFPGSKPLDDVELLAEENFRSLLGVGQEYRVSIQPHSGTQANQIVFNTVLEPEDVVLSMSPAHGGHVSHTVLVGRRNKAYHYRTTPEGRIDYDEVEALAREHQPKLIVAGASSHPLAINYHRLSSIAQECGAYLLSDIAHSALFVMGSLHPSPFPYADFATLTLMKNLRGPTGGVLVYRSNMGGKVSAALFPGTQGGPSENALLAKAVTAQKLLDIDLSAYGHNLIANAQLLGDRLSLADIPIRPATTDCHYILADLQSLERSGLDSERALERFGILVNRNLVPGDPKPPRVTSGLRIGSTCVTILGYQTTDLKVLGDAVAAVIKGHGERVQPDIQHLVDTYHRPISGANAETR